MQSGIEVPRINMSPIIEETWTMAIRSLRGAVLALAAMLWLGSVSDAQGNPGGGNEALATEKAKAQGKDRKGEEPDSAKPSK